MLKFIFGRAATGKTSSVLQLIKQDTQNGKNVVLIIPEQFSFESEKSVLHLLGDTDAEKVEVLSFSRLCDAVDRLTGGICSTVLSDSDKLILMARAINMSADELELWGKYKNSRGFAKNILDNINEFKLNAVSYEDILNAADKSESGTLALKLRDISTIYKNFNMLLGEKFLDPSDRLERLYDKLYDCRYFENKTVYIDSFDGFTGQQYKIINQILSSADDVTISLLNKDNGVKYDLFENIRKTAERIRKSAIERNIEIAEDTVLSKSFYKSNNIALVEALLSGSKADNLQAEENDDGVTIINANTPYDEAEFVAREVRRLVRENKDLRYRDIVVIARDTGLYEENVISAFAKNKVSCFVDKRVPLSAFPPVIAALSAISVATDFSTKALLDFYKIGLTDIPIDKIFELENYTYIWGIEGDLWYSDWTMNPEGFKTGEISEDSAKKLYEINKTRQDMLSYFSEFKENFKGSPKNRAKEIVKLFDKCNLRTALLKMKQEYKAKGEKTYAEALSSAFDTFMQLLDSIVNCMESGSVSNREFTDTLKNSLSFSSVGIAPQKLDEVTFGAADRIRPSRPKIAFILGANQNLFPRTAKGGGILANRERDILISLGIDISDRSISESIDEEFLVYSNVCCPTQRLYISYHTLDNEGKEAEPSAFVELIKDNIVCKKTIEPKPIEADNLPETLSAAFSAYCHSLAQYPEKVMTIGKALLSIEEIKPKLKLIEKGYEKRNYNISPNTAEKLFGDKISISPSRLDNFMACSFSFLCKFGFKAYPLQKAEFDVMQRGTIVHYILERIISEYRSKIAEFTDEKIAELVDFYTEEYLDSVTGYRTIENPRFKFLVYTIKRSVKEIVRQIANEFAQSKFEPVAFELNIGKGEIPPLEIDLYDNKKISVGGQVDRVDLWDNYIRIVDYKTGSRKFRLPDILVGQNMQMLIYLYALIKNGTYKGKDPAGIFYMPAKRDLNGGGLRMDGLSVCDEELAFAMEAENKGEFVTPLKFNKNGDIDWRSANKFIDKTDFSAVFCQIERMLYKMGANITEGNFKVNPTDSIDNNACKYCEYSAICAVENKPHKKAQPLKNSEVIAAIREEMN